MSVQPTIYCDMDGVLCDFMAGMTQLTDKPIELMSVSQMWKLSRTKQNFWSDLAWADGGQALWEIVDLYNGHILSSLPYSDPNSESGKRRWLRNNIQLTDFDRIHLVKRRNAKQEYAVFQGNPNVLIDDYIKNVREWQSAGGIAILHTHADQTLAQLQKLGFAINLESA